MAESRRNAGSARLRGQDVEPALSTATLPPESSTPTAKPAKPLAFTPSKFNLTIWPTQVLEHLVSYLSATGIGVLKLSSKLLARRFDTEPIVLRWTENKVVPISAIRLAFGPHLRRLEIRLSRAQYHWNPEFSWVADLPKTLEEIDFAFGCSPSIWLASQGVLRAETPHKAFSRDGRYAVLDLSKLLPNLVSLRLEGTQGAFINPAGEDPSVTAIQWTSQMRAHFYTHLPATLLELHVPLWGYTHQILPHLPPHITSLVDTTGMTTSRPMLMMGDDSTTTAMPSAKLCASLVSYTWTTWQDAEPKSFAKALQLFTHIEHLDLQHVFLHPSNVILLPRRLLSLKIRCGIGLQYPSPTANTATECITHEHLAHLPPKLRLLHLTNLDGDRIDPNHPYDHPLPAHIPIISDLCQLLPTSLTELGIITPLLKPWRPSVELAGLGTVLTQLRVLELDSGSYCRIQFDTLAWLPCNTVETLKISNGDWRLRYVPPGLVGDELFTTFPPGLPNRIRTLILGGYAGKSLHTANHLPPNLTKLEMATLSDFNFSHLTTLLSSALPSTLTTINLQYDSEIPISAMHWRADDLVLPMVNRQKAAAQTGAAPPASSLASVDVGIVQDLGTILPKDLKTLDHRTLVNLWRLPGYELLRNLPFESTSLQVTNLPKTLTSIDLPLVLGPSSRDLYELKSLTSFKINTLWSSVFGANIQNDTHLVPSLPQLTTLHIKSTAVSTFWLSSALFASLTDLRVPMWEHPTHDSKKTVREGDMAKLSRLTTLYMGTFDHHPRTRRISPLIDYQKLIAALPAGLVALETSILPPEFWEAYTGPPTAAKASTSSSSSTSWFRSAISGISNVVDNVLYGPPPVQPAFRLRTLITSHLLKDHQIALLHPHLTELSARVVMITDELKLLRNLKRDLRVINDLALAQAICPSIITARATTSKFTSAKKIEWTHEADIDSLSAKSIRDCYEALPASLLEVGSIVTHDAALWKHLPRSLTLLDASEQQISSDAPFDDLPSSLTSLSITLSDERDLEKVIKKLPPQLLELSIGNVGRLHKSSLAFPPLLTRLSMPHLTLGPRNLLPTLKDLRFWLVFDLDPHFKDEKFERFPKLENFVLRKYFPIEAHPPDHLLELVD